MKPENTNKARRRILQGLTVGGAIVSARSLPEQWTRPLVEAVTLPAHAQISPGGIMTDSGFIESEQPGIENFQLQQRLRSRLSSLGIDMQRAGAIRVTSSATPDKSLIDYIVSPAAATENVLLTYEASLETDGRFTFSVLLSGEAVCPDSETTVDVDFNMCVRGQFAAKRAGETTLLTNSCDFPAPAEILDIDDNSAQVRVDFEGNEVLVDLELGGSVPACADCNDEFDRVIGRIEDGCGIEPL